MFNKPWYRRLINEYGPPISYEDNVTVPFRDTRLLYPTEEGKYDGIVRSIAQILEAFGLPWEEAGRSSEILWDRMWEVIDSRPTE
ncbi:hypothetical protein GCM10008985_32050 [Halococcus dombrowskii]|uniref:Uncharacterized protein n=1 Tax=Halococcus dombrowskii TaxID=179637 RepID=A0AAV3SLE4_HALDO